MVHTRIEDVKESSQQVLGTGVGDVPYESLSRGIDWRCWLEAAACELLSQKKLCEILPEYRDTAKNVYLFYQHSCYVQPKIKHFIDFFIMKVERDTIL